MSTNINRHQAGATVAGEKTGGQFKAGERTSADGNAFTQAVLPPKVKVTAPARTIELDTPSSPIEWPEGFTNIRVDFAEDDSGRFFTAYTFEHAEAGEVEIIYTDFEDGADFSDGVDPDLFEEVSEPINRAHDTLRRNHYKAGAYALERDVDLYEQVKAASLGLPRPDPATDKFAGRPDQAAEHRVKQLLTAYGARNPEEAEEHEIQDMLTDLMWVAKSRGFDFDELSDRAARVRQDEEDNPDF